MCAFRYTDQDYDSEFIEVLQTQCYKYIKQEGDPTLEDVSNFIHVKVTSIWCTDRAVAAMKVDRPLCKNKALHHSH